MRDRRMAVLWQLYGVLKRRLDAWIVMMPCSSVLVPHDERTKRKTSKPLPAGGRGQGTAQHIEDGRLRRRAPDRTGVHSGV